MTPPIFPKLKKNSPKTFPPIFVYSEFKMPGVRHMVKPKVDSSVSFPIIPPTFGKIAEIP